MLSKERRSSLKSRPSSLKFYSDNKHILKTSLFNISYYFILTKNFRMVPVGLPTITVSTRLRRRSPEGSCRVFVLDDGHSEINGLFIKPQF